MTDHFLGIKRTDNSRCLPEVKKLRWPEIYGYFDPDRLAPSDLPPAEVQAALEDVYGDCAKWNHTDTYPPDPTRPGWVKLRLHPWFKRWCVFEWCVDPKTYEFCWRPQYVAFGEPTGTLPSDLDNSDGRYDNLKTTMGEYIMPTRRDFEEVVDMMDRRRNTAESTTLKASARHDKALREADRIQGDRERDMISYYFAMACRDANREFGSMQGLPFVPQTSLAEQAKLNEFLYDWTEVYASDGTLLYRTKRRKKSDELRKALDEYAEKKRVSALIGGDPDVAYNAAVAILEHEERKARHKEIDAAVELALPTTRDVEKTVSKEEKQKKAVSAKLGLLR